VVFWGSARWEYWFRKNFRQENKTTPCPSALKRNIPTERPPFVSKIMCQLLWIEGCRVVSAADPPRLLISVFWTGATTFLSSSTSFIKNFHRNIKIIPTYYHIKWHNAFYNSKFVFILLYTSVVIIFIVKFYRIGMSP
jgi:hypothetical protein